MNNKKVKFKYFSTRNQAVPTLFIKPNHLLISKISKQKLSKALLNNFSKSLSKYEKRILQEISKLFGDGWKEKDIFIYPLPEETKIPSTSFPLFLKLRDNQKLNLYFLIHELIHRLLETNSKLKRKITKGIGKKRLFMEAFVVFATQKVFSKVFSLNESQKMRMLEKGIVTSRNENIVDKIIKTKKNKFKTLITSR